MIRQDEDPVYIELKDIVLNSLSKYVFIPKNEVKITDKLVKDLHIDATGFAIECVQICEELGLSIPLEAWENVATVKDVVELLYSNTKK